jgi:hypothetical protein
VAGKQRGDGPTTRYGNNSQNALRPESKDESLGRGIQFEETGSDT